MKRREHRVCAAALLLFVAACGRAPLVSQASPGADVDPVTARPDVLPTRCIAGHLLVEATLDGRGPFFLLLDTGSSYLVLSPRTVGTLGLARVALGEEGNGLRLGTGTDDIQVQEGAVVEELRAGSLVLRRTSALLIDLEPFERLIETRLDGILPVAAFRDGLLTVDLARGVVELSSGALPAADGQDVLDLHLAGGRPFVLLDVAGHPCWAVVDTGSTDYLRLPSELEASLSFRTHPVPVGKIATAAGISGRREGRLDGAVSWGRHSIADPIVSFAGAPHAIVGVPLLREFRMTFDIAHARVRFERTSDGPLVTPPVRSPGFGWVLDGDVWTIVYVLEESPAARAGLTVGDRIERVEGRRVDAVDRTTFEAWVAARDTLTFRVARPSGAIDLRLEVATLVK